MTPLLGEISGVGQTVRAMSQGLADDPSIDLTGFAVSRRAGGRLAEVAPPGAATMVLPVPARVAHLLWSHVSWPRLGGFDIVHGANFVVPPAAGGIEIVTVHDLTAWRWPDMVSDSSRSYPALVARAIKRGAYIHTVSDFVASEVQELLGLPADRVRRIYNGVSATEPGNPTTGRQLAGGRDYVLAVGTIEPRKDYPSLVRAFAELRHSFPDLNLVIAGGRGWGAAALDEAITASGLGDAITQLGYVTDAQRRDLIAGTSCFVYPSLYEGFGLPPLEAMAQGVPVVVTDAGAVAEVVGEAACIVPVGDPAALADGVGAILSGSDLNLTLRTRGPVQAARYRWNYTNVELTAWYRELIG